MQDDEGFDNNQKVQLVDFNYRPLSIQQEVKRSIFTQPRSKESWQEVDKYLPSRDELRQQCSHELISKEQQYIVFNNFNHEIGLQEHQLVFQTDFQSSNLEIVTKRKYLEYELYMRPDTNTNAYFQWFYFRVKCWKAKKNVTFTIKNFVKSSMLYSQGLKPFYRSSKDNNAKYAQLPTDVKYTQNYDGYFNLKFNYQFQQDAEVVEFCSQPPYTYTKILQKINTLKGEKLNLCKSQLGKKVPYLIYNEQKQTKAVVIAIARQHPGETVGSWIMDGFLSKIQKGLFQSILWIVIPMINVDGVILGNNRTGIAGLDYNRFWNLQELQKKERYFPELISLFAILKGIRRKHPRKMKMFLDFHGHSSQPNVFSYGPPHQYGSENFFLSRIFPELLSRRNQNFSLEQSSYTIKQDKKNTARSMLYSFYNVPFSYTIQASFGLMRGKNIGIQEFIQIGQDIAQTTNDFLCNFILKEKTSELNSIIAQIREKYKQKGDEGEEYDSDSEAIPQKKEDLQSKNPSHSSHSKSEMREKVNKFIRPRLATDNGVPYHKDSHQENSFHLFKIEQVSPQRRYVRINQGKRNETEVTLSKGNKTNFLPKLKQTFTSRQKMKNVESKEVQNSIATLPESSPMTNIKEIQKHLFRLRNSRIGKKILIINAYGI